MKITQIPWGQLRPYSQFVASDGTLYTLLNVDTARFPYVVTALDRSRKPAGEVVARTVEPWSSAFAVHPENDSEAISVIARHFIIEGVKAV